MTTIDRRVAGDGWKHDGRATVTDEFFEIGEVAGTTWPLVISLSAEMNPTSQLPTTHSLAGVQSLRIVLE